MTQSDSPLRSYNELMQQGKACIANVEDCLGRDSSVGAREWAQAARECFAAVKELMLAKGAKAAMTTLSGGSDTQRFRAVVDGQELTLHLPRAVVEGGTTLLVEGYPAGLAVEQGIEAIQTVIDAGFPWVRVQLVGTRFHVEIQCSRVIGIMPPPEAES